AGADTVAWSKNVGLHPGPNYIYVSAFDNSDVQNQASQTITIVFQPGDSLPPNLIVTSHTNGATVFTSTITLAGTASDAGRGDSGISSVTCRGKIAGATATGAGTINWSQTVDVTPGRNTFFISASDNSPFPNTTSLTLTINFQPADNLPPSLNV